jgi:hypothetical protein
MILNTAPQAEAVMSNVGEIGEFRIRNSAKAFNILSSGLYANKIKAIVRELSCNAVDSHTAAGNSAPFEVHLPTTLEPHFSIRDFGTGLNHDQVTSIYTTYFESTKTGSNDFIGALGLGSKSPFSYTDNFTVTAIKDGRKGIYTAFINDAGVPSIALMMEEQTDEPSGVEVKFAVNERYDFEKFKQEAQSVYQYFAIKPVITGVSNFQIPELKYDTKDIIPGVHSYNNDRGSVKTRAIMGNIAYPIEVPNKALGDLQKLLDCGLELHFNIGELDFQASREGLSYIPQTIEAIRSKLQQLNNALSGVLVKDADAITNNWERSIFLNAKKNHTLWSNAVSQYVVNTGFKLFENRLYSSTYDIKVNIEDMKRDFNLVMRSFYKSKSENTCRNQEPRRHTDYVNDVNGNRIAVQTSFWEIPVSTTTYFVKNDTKLGVTERAKYHWRNITQKDYTNIIFVLEPADRTKPAKFKEFLESLSGPPETQVLFGSSLKEKPRAGGIGKNVSILFLEQRTRNSGYRDSKYYVWTAAKFNDLDPKKTYYYVPLKGYEMISTKKYPNTPHNLFETLLSTGIPELNVRTVYGVRKSDLEAIKLQKNWINIEDHITQVLSNIPQSVVDGIVKKSLESEAFMLFGSKLMEKLDAKNPIKVLYDRYDGVKEIRLNQPAVTMLSNIYTTTSKLDPSKEVAKARNMCDNIYARYPLLNCVDTHKPDKYVPALAEYINMIDTVKGL